MRQRTHVDAWWPSVMLQGKAVRWQLTAYVAAQLSAHGAVRRNFSFFCFLFFLVCESQRILMMSDAFCIRLTNYREKMCKDLDVK
jgi:hypothetical protein